MFTLRATPTALHYTVLIVQTVESFTLKLSVLERQIWSTNALEVCLRVLSFPFNGSVIFVVG